MILIRHSSLHPNVQSGNMTYVSRTGFLTQISGYMVLLRKWCILWVTLNKPIYLNSSGFSTSTSSGGIRSHSLLSNIYESLGLSKGVIQVPIFLVCWASLFFHVVYYIENKDDIFWQGNGLLVTDTNIERLWLQGQFKTEIILLPESWPLYRPWV